MTVNLLNAIVYATRQVWRAEAAGRILLADTWGRELAALLREYRTERES